MSDDSVLMTLPHRLSEDDITYYLAGYDEPLSRRVRVQRNGLPIEVGVLDALMADFESRRAGGAWDDDRAKSDRWLAPRVHYALRLTRFEASDKGTWQWLTLRFPGYVRWRWGLDGGTAVQADRWFGPIHKQALARLWWGAEIFRNGNDYSFAERAFVRQDLINSYLHRPIVRCRSLAVAILDVIAPGGREMEVSSTEVNDVARTLNLITAGTPPEVAVRYQSDDFGGYSAWVAEAPSPVPSWDPLPRGPNCADVTERSFSGGLGIARRARDLASAAGRKANWAGMTRLICCRRHEACQVGN